jgi:hypothetical protein
MGLRFVLIAARLRSAILLIGVFSAICGGDGALATVRKNSAEVITMPLYYENLDDRTRGLMLEELDYDIAHNHLYISPYLSGQGQRDYPNLLRQAMLSGNDETLAQALRAMRRIERSYQKHKPGGAGYTIATVPENAAEVVADSEFNRYYIRALARRALADGIPELIVYRAKPVARPRPESESLVETTVDPAAVLEDLRAHPGERPDMGVPGGPGSGISVRLP